LLHGETSSWTLALEARLALARGDKDAASSLAVETRANIPLCGDPIASTALTPLE
jgi:hypothetical protein